MVVKAPLVGKVSVDPLLESHKTSEQHAVALFLSDINEDSFSGVFAAMYPKLIRFFRLRGCDYASAEELAEDVLTSVYRHVGSLRQKESFFGWLFHIAHNQLMQHIRKSRLKVETVCLNEVLGSSPRQSVCQSPEPSDLMTWIQTLNTADQRLITMRYMEDLSYKEIATALNLPLGTVKWQLFAAKAKLAGLTK